MATTMPVEPIGTNVQLLLWQQKQYPSFCGYLNVQGLSHGLTNGLVSN